MRHLDSNCMISGPLLPGTLLKHRGNYKGIRWSPTNQEKQQGRRKLKNQRWGCPSCQVKLPTGDKSLKRASAVPSSGPVFWQCCIKQITWPRMRINLWKHLFEQRPDQRFCTKEECLCNCIVYIIPYPFGFGGEKPLNKPVTRKPLVSAGALRKLQPSNDIWKTYRSLVDDASLSDRVSRGLGGIDCLCRLPIWYSLGCCWRSLYVMLGSWKARALVPMVWPVTLSDVGILIVNIPLYRSWKGLINKSTLACIDLWASYFKACRGM